MLSRVAQAGLWLVVGVGIVAALLDGAGARSWVPAVAVVVIAASGVLAVRAYRVGATYGPDGIEVRGYFRTRRIQRNQVTQVTDFPAVRWKDTNGKPRWTPISAFSGSSGQLRMIERHNAVCLALLQLWDEERHQKPTRTPRRTRRR
ncbi:hypothetical protein Kfla_0304 [Kribbella flavida DSM 17836]|uniref:PH domain-containing protein n=2 Tax=Kribbella flavida TaxID=182640 RepID=D2PTB2_KRIFD|nr:hypothetical protein Kfla_0304 [Kribbella flavida DSM 17836]